MNKNKKIFLIISIALVSIILLVGVTYAVFSYQEEGSNKELIVGDIYMHYKENNQLVLSDAMPISAHDYYVNPIIATQEVEEINELTKCVNYFSHEKNFDNGSDVESYCKGYGTTLGKTFQEELENEYFISSYAQYLMDLGIILYDSENYLVNPTMQSQEVEETNELTKCVVYYIDNEYFDSGSDPENFCKGEGTILGDTFQQQIKDGWFSSIELKYLKENNIIFSEIEDLPYFEFTISGKNTYSKKDIYYEILLNYGDEHEDRTTRIRDDLLRFKLVEVIDGVENTIIDNKEYSDLTNQRIWTTTISKNTNEEIEITYRLYMWIGEYIIIGNMNEDYTLEEWEDVYASIKVNVNGYFRDDDYVTKEFCFETENTTGGVRITNYNNGCGRDVVIPSQINGSNVVGIGNGSFHDKNLTSIKIPNSVIEIGRQAFYNNQLVKIEIPDSVEKIGYFAFAFNHLETIILGSSVFNIEHDAFPMNYFYGGSNAISKVINKTGKEFYWEKIFGAESTDGNNSFETGIFKYYYNGNREILITSE